MPTPAAQAYSNARRAGRTHPDLVEVIGKGDPRHPAYVPPPVKLSIMRRQPRPNRAERRARGQRTPVDLDSCRRPVTVAGWDPGAA